MLALKRLWPLLPLAAIVALGYAAGLQDELNWASLGRRQSALRALVTEAPVRAAGVYVALYVACTAVSFPGSVVITVAGGLLFGTVLGAGLTVVGATTGGTLLFLAARSALAPLLAARAGPWMERLRPGLERNGFATILALRLVPVVPFWLINLAAALSSVKLRHFVAATFVGIIPATTVFASIGAGIGTALEAGGRPDLSIILSPTFLLPLLGLAVLSLLPMAWRAWKGRHA